MSDAFAVALIALLGAVIGAVIGAGGSLLTQVLAGRGDKERLASEEHRHTQVLFFESKRVAYSKVVALVDERFSRMQGDLISDWEQGKSWEYIDSTWFERWIAVRGEVGLLDIAITDPLEIVLNQLADWSNEIGHGYIEHALEHCTLIANARGDLIDQMKQSLSPKP